MVMSVDYQVQSAIYGVLGLVLIGLIALLVWAMEKMVRLTDRYRMKYGFDKELEAKEFGNDTEKMDRREKRFKKRVFKD